MTSFKNNKVAFLLHEKKQRCSDIIQHFLHWLRPKNALTQAYKEFNNYRTAAATNITTIELKHRAE